MFSTFFLFVYLLFDNQCMLGYGLFKNNMLFKYCGFIYHIWTCNKRERICFFFVVSIIFCMICVMFFILSHILWTLATLQKSTRTRQLNSHQMFPSTLYQSTSEINCDIINEELMSPQKHCIKYTVNHFV